MSKTDIFSFLSGIPIGTIVAWISATVAIIAAVVYGILKLYKLFELSRKIRQENSDYQAMVKAHDAQLNNISEQLAKIQSTLDKQDELSLKNMRHFIVRAGEEAISNGSITIRKLRSLEEMYEEYSTSHGNGYVTTLMKKVRALKVIGKLDENDEDIEEDELNDIDLNLNLKNS